MNYYAGDYEGTKEVNFPSNDFSLNQKRPSLEKGWKIHPDKLKEMFLEPYGLEYLLDAPIKVITHPKPTTTCEEKAELLEVDRAQTVMALYLQHKDTDEIYVIVAPKLGDFIDKKSLNEPLEFNARKKLEYAQQLPANMEPGTCNPFICASDASKITKMIFDSNILEDEVLRNKVYDFSLAVNIPNVDNKQLSVHLTYSEAFDLLKKQFGDKVIVVPISYISKNN